MARRIKILPLCASSLETEWRGIVLEANKKKPLNYVST